MEGEREFEVLKNGCRGRKPVQVQMAPVLDSILRPPSKTPHLRAEHSVFLCVVVPKRSKTPPFVCTWAHKGIGGCDRFSLKKPLQKHRALIGHRTSKMSLPLGGRLEAQTIFRVCKKAPGPLPNIEPPRFPKGIGHIFDEPFLGLTCLLASFVA